jgi:hypothetical protein
LRFHGSSASIASTVVASGSCSNTSLRYSKGSSPLARAVHAERLTTPNGGRPRLVSSQFAAAAFGIV